MQMRLWGHPMTGDLGKQPALPSRDAEEWGSLVRVLRDEGLDMGADIIEAWRSGRLVDRDTIDAWIAEHRYGPGDWVVDDAALDAFAAAIGDTDKGVVS